MVLDTRTICLNIKPVRVVARAAQENIITEERMKKKLKLIFALLFAKEYLVLIDRGEMTQIGAVVKDNSVINVALRAVEDTQIPTKDHYQTNPFSILNNLN